jgi:hypothetical protein
MLRQRLSFDEHVELAQRIKRIRQDLYWVSNKMKDVEGIRSDWSRRCWNLACDAGPLRTMIEDLEDRLLVDVRSVPYDEVLEVYRGNREVRP